MPMVSQPEASPGRGLLVSEVLRLQYSQKPQHEGCVSLDHKSLLKTQTLAHLTALTYPCTEPGFGLSDPNGSFPTWDTLGFTPSFARGWYFSSFLPKHTSQPPPLLLTQPQCILAWERSAATQLHHQHRNPDPLLNHSNPPAHTLRR